MPFGADNQRACMTYADGDDFRLFFLHIPKTAGTSFVDTVKPWFEPGQSANYIEGMDATAQATLGDKRFISGHLFYDQVRRLPYIDHCRLISIFRDPYARLASHLRYMDRYNQPEYAVGFNALREDLQQVVLAIARVDFGRPEDLERLFAALGPWARAAFENCQTRFLVCDQTSPDASPFEDLPDGALDLALERLEALDMVGVSEQLDAMIQRLAASLDIAPPPRVARSNTASSDRCIDITDPAIRVVMAPLVGQDERVYARAKALFNLGGVEQTA